MMLWRALVSCCCSSSQPVVVIVESTNPVKSYGVFVMSDRSCNRDTRKCTPEAQATQTCKPTNLQVWGKNLSFFLNLLASISSPLSLCKPNVPTRSFMLSTNTMLLQITNRLCMCVCLSLSFHFLLSCLKNEYSEKVVGSFPSDQDIYPLGCCKHGFCDHTSFPLCFSNLLCSQSSHSSTSQALANCRIRAVRTSIRTVTHHKMTSILKNHENTVCSQSS